MRINWTPDLETPPSSYTLTKRDLGSSTYGALAIIPFSVTGPNYDKVLRVFFYEDVLVGGGDTVRIQPVDSYGDLGEPLYVIAPPGPPPRCLIVGYVYDASGQPMPGVAVYATTSGSHRQQGVRVSSEVVGAGRANVLLHQAPTVVHTDEHGMWQHQLMRGVGAAVIVPSIQFGRAFYVPGAEGPVNVLDVQQMVSQDFNQLWPEARGLALNVPVA